MADRIISASTIAYRGYALDVALSSIARTGIQWVEPALIGSYFPEIDDSFFDSKKAAGLRNSVSQAGLRVHSVGVHMDLGLRGAVESFRRRLTFAQEVGARVVISNATTRSNISSFFANMETLAKEAERSSLIIALENPGDGAANIIGETHDSLEVIRRIDSPYIRLNYDYCNVYTYSRGARRPEEECHEVWPVVAHLHLKDVKRVDGGLRFCSVGSGIVDYAPLFEKINAHPIPMSIEMPLFLERGSKFEMIFRENTDELSTIEAVLKASLNYISKNLRAADVSRRGTFQTGSQGGGV